MKLPFVASFFKKKAPTQYFLALLFRDEQIHAVVFEEINGRIQVVGEGKAMLPASLERASDDMLLDAADKAISIAEETLPNGMETHKTVFGVKETWVVDTHITKEYLSRLKTISDQLDLKPIGFLVFPEAIAHLLQKEEGAPVSAILVEAGKQQVSITMIRAGRLIGTKEVTKSESITETVEHALKQFDNVEILPSRIILFDAGDTSLEKIFLSHKWSKSLPFLHVPQITTLPHDFDTRAILFGTATQMGFDAIDLVKQPLKRHESVFEEKALETTEETPLHQEEKIIETSEEEVLHQKAEPSQTPQENQEDMEEVVGQDASEYFGFVKNADVAEHIENPHETSLRHKNEIDGVTGEIPEEEKESELAGEAPGFSMAGPAFFEGAKKIFAKIKNNSPKTISLQSVSSLFATFSAKLPGKGNKLVYVIPLVVVLVIGIVLWYIFGSHAIVTITFNPKIITKDQSITFSANDSTDPSQNIIHATPVAVSEEGKVSGSATGTKDVGTPAKGTVTIFNSDSASHTVNAGTIVTCTAQCSGALTFTLDNDVTVASGSSDPTSLSAGTADVSVTATDIGTDYNIPSGAKFSLPNTDVLAAKNNNAFSGGSKNTITVVSQKDLDALTSQLTNNLSDKARSDLSSQVQNDSVLLPGFTNTNPTTTNFDKKAGDQSSSITLDGTINFASISYKKSDIENYTKSVVNNSLSPGTMLSSKGVTYSVKDLTAKDGTTNATLTMKAALIPTIDIKSLASQIAGKSFTQAQDILSGLPQYANSQFSLSPNLFFLPRVLPRLANNITISVGTNE